MLFFWEETCWSEFQMAAYLQLFFNLMHLSQVFHRATNALTLTSSLTSPTYFCTSSEPMTRMKQASVLLATALAQSVLPVPGGPNSSTPFGGSIPRLTNLSGCDRDTNFTLTTSHSKNIKIVFSLLKIPLFDPVCSIILQDLPVSSTVTVIIYNSTITCTP